MPTETIEPYITEILSSPAVAQAVRKAQELDAKISQIHEGIIVPQMKESQEKQYQEKIVEDIKEDLESALEKIGPQARNRFISYFAGGDLYRSITKAINEGNSRDMLRSRYHDDSSWTNAIRKLDYSTAEEKTRDYALEVKEQELEKIGQLKDEDKIKYLLNEIQNSPEKNEIYEQIATILKGLGYQPKSLENTVSQADNNQNQSQQRTPQDSRTENGGLEQSTSQEQERELQNQEKTPKEEFGKIENPSDYLRYITGLKKEEKPDDEPDYLAQYKELKDAYKASLKPKEKENTEENVPHTEVQEENSSENIQQEEETEEVEEEQEEIETQQNSQPQETAQEEQDIAQQPQRDIEQMQEKTVDEIQQRSQEATGQLEEIVNNREEESDTSTQENDVIKDAGFEVIENETQETIEQAISDILSEKSYTSQNPDAGTIVTRENFENYKSQGENSKELQNNFKYNINNIVESKTNTPTSLERKFRIKTPQEELPETIESSIQDILQNEIYQSNNPDAGTIVTQENKNLYFEIPSNEPTQISLDQEQIRQTLRATRKYTEFYTEEELDVLEEMDEYVKSGKGTHAQFWETKNNKPK